MQKIYPIIFIDTVHFSVRQENVVKKIAAYVVLGIGEDGIKEVLSLEIGQNESSKFWLSVLNSLKSRGIRDVMGNFVLTLGNWYDKNFIVHCYLK